MKPLGIVLVGGAISLAALAGMRKVQTSSPQVPAQIAPPESAPGGLSHFSNTAPLRLGDWKERALPRSPVSLDDYVGAIDQPGNKRVFLGGLEYQTLPLTYRPPSEKLPPGRDYGVGGAYLERQGD